MMFYKVFVMDNDTHLLAVGDVGVSSIGSCLTLEPNRTQADVNSNAVKLKSNDTTLVGF